MATEELKKIVDDDIKKCEEAITKNNKHQMNELHKALISKWSPIIDGFKDDLYILIYDEDGSSCKSNLQTMKEKLLLFKAMCYENIYTKQRSNEITIQNTNRMDIAVNVSFGEVKEQIENMTSLPQKEINEILEQIARLEKIINSPEKKSVKWEKSKDIIKWVADKGMDVGIALLPLLLKIGQV